MKMLRVCLCFLLLVSLGTSAPSDIATFKLSFFVRPDKTLEMELDVAVPKTPGSYPVILFLTGLSGLAPAYMESELVNSVAQQGYAWMTISKFRSPNHEKITDSVSQVIAWLNANIGKVFDQRVPGVIPDIENRLILAGHSAAGHVTTQYLNQTCGTVKGQILLSPVDGVDPFGIKRDYIITPGKFLPYATPVLVLKTELDPEGRDHVAPPCAPVNLSNTRFYNAMSGPKWFLDISKYGHADFFNNEYRLLAAAICKTCTHNCNFPEYRTLIKDIIVNFVKGVLNGDKKAFKFIEQRQFAIPSTGYHDYMSYNPFAGGFCKRVGSQDLIEDNTKIETK